jgi:hypothetical protein
MKIKFIILFTLIAASTNSHASYFEKFIKTVSSQCQNTSTLILKKVLIELNRNEKCEGTFTAKLLNECKSMSCNELLTIYQDISQEVSGSVIGR